MTIPTKFEVGKRYVNRAGGICYVREFSSDTWWHRDTCTGTITVVLPDGRTAVLWADGKYAGKGVKNEDNPDDLIAEYYPAPEQEQLDLF